MVIACEQEVPGHTIGAERSDLLPLMDAPHHPSKQACVGATTVVLRSVIIPRQTLGSLLGSTYNYFDREAEAHRRE